MEIEFPAALAVGGALIIGAAALSGLVHRTILSPIVLSVGAGALLSGSGVLTVDPGGETVIVLAELVLLLTLFSDGLAFVYPLGRRGKHAAGWRLALGPVG